MSFRWSELGSSPASSPATPDRISKKATFGFSVDHPSTTPAGPPPPSASSAGTFTPMGDPSPSFLQSPVGGMSNKPKAPNFGKPSIRGSKSGSKGGSAPLGRSIRGSARQPSRLSREYHGEDDDNDGDDGEGDDQDDQDNTRNAPTTRSGTFAMSFDDTTEGEDNTDPLDDDERDYDNDSQQGVDEEDEDGYGVEDEVEAMVEDAVAYDVEEDLLKEIAGASSYQGPLEDADGDTDLMMFATPAADERIRREADDIYRASAMRSTMARKREVKYAVLAKDLYSHVNFATTLEPDNVLLQTEDIVNRLYDEGVGTEDDEEKLDNTLSQACLRLVNDVWTPYMESLPKVRDEHSAKVGPSSSAPTFEKAMYLSSLIFRIHHTPPVQDEFGGSRVPLLPEILFKWQEDEHNLDGHQTEIILRHRPSPAAHGLFWQAVFNTLVRGNIAATVRLLRNATWESVKKTPRGESAYVGQALANIRRAVEDLCQIMEGCPSIINDSWDIRSSDWTLFRLKAKAGQEALINFAEGKDRSNFASSRFNNSHISNSPGGKPSLAGLARKAESLIPWDVYENLQSLYAILTGEPEAILASAQDWCEATVGLFGWWDDGHNKRGRGLSHSRSAHSIPAANDEDFLDRLALCLQTATESDFHFNSADAVEVSVASAFEGNVEGVIGFLRLWSLPIAASVAEIASLGRWLPLPEPQNLISMSEFDMEELEVLGMKQSSGPDDKDGIKDSTLIHYARGLRDRKQTSGSIRGARVTRDGWELAVQVIGRIDSHERSEQMVQELLQNVLSTVDENSRATIDKMWGLLNDLGMINFAEDTAETFGDILAKDTFRFGEALRYYALAHRPGKVRDVLNTLMSISLVESTVYPPEGDLDDSLRALLRERTATLEDFAKQDLEAAELLAKMLSGYATLRQFYEHRDHDGNTAHKKSLMRRQQAAAALTAVIASADDNIRGGLYDDTRDAVVSEDFLLALLGEISVFVGQSPPLINLHQIDTLLKAIEDIQTVGSRVYDVADEFFKLVLASGHGKGSTPANLLSQSTPSLGGSFVMTGSSMIASQLHKSVVKSGMIKGSIKRGWDWRSTIFATSSSGEVLKQLRLDLSKDLANLWLEQADNVIL
ncbi:hypothetical protein F5B22DRAFT_234576 [Xylaria bambusicola]|uniref:uncharacterized protein n=1 Tax=Xylaria bambusicola TaxID=326684 RepID=UPI0020073556|nr:uncharacterized protein F5B22DRAFT_234576 [Xylaria bambusicola]KAI0514590.1 hypothetical protein F5B22DRAFT_234576 [Xylaria bambusicola]